MSHSFRHILVIRFSSIGDIVLTSPVVRALKNQFPSAKIHFVTKSQYAPLLQANPHIDQLHILDGNLLQLAINLRPYRFDFILDLHNNQRTLMLKSILQRPSGTFSKRNWAKWKMVKWHHHHKVEPIVDRYFQAGHPIGLQSDGLGLEHFISQEDMVSLQTVLPKTSQPFIAAGIGGSFKTKVFPLPKWQQLIPQLQAPIVLLGGPEDKPMADQLQAAFSSKVFHRIGEWSVQQSASIVSQAAGVIANDTGIMHIAAAFKKPLAVVWGNTTPAFGMGPYYGKKVPPDHRNFEVEGLECRPCSKLGYATCPKQHFRCMYDIPIRDVADFVNQVLSK